ncbi:uncharacterized protein [Hemitrygon akajei]|uniref:uncharacterized protein n=1 Tax=Hemitrygon akajei TaxID=2704970 RepID=UPI003BF9B6E0
MGISRLSELIREQAAEAVTNKTIHAYEGRVMALDAAVVMNQFRMARPNKRYLHHLSQIVGVFYRTASLLEKGIKPVFVFDGPAPRMKSRVLRKRLGWRPTLENEEHTCRPAPESEERACATSPEREEHACTTAPESEGCVCLTTMEREEHTWRPIPGGCRLVTESEGCVRRPGGEKEGGDRHLDRAPTAKSRTVKVSGEGLWTCSIGARDLGSPMDPAPGGGWGVEGAGDLSPQQLSTRPTI